MMKTRTRILLFVMICLMFFSIFTVSADTRSQSASGKCGNNLTWVLYSDGELVISGSGKMKSYQSWVDSPSAAYDGYWKDVDVPWKNVQKLTVKSGVTSIGAGAFARCTSLKTVIIEPGVTVIEREAFRECSSLVDITLPQGLETISENAFYECTSLKTIVIPQSINKIENEAFYACPLIEVTIPQECSIGLGAFSARLDENSGKCGANAFWKIENNVLTISGYGKMDNYDWGARGGYQCSPPWSSYLYCNCIYDFNPDYPCKLVEKFIISEGITNISSQALTYNEGAAVCHECSIYVPSTVKHIEKGAFFGISKVFHKIYYNGTVDDWKTVKDESSLMYYSTPAVEIWIVSNNTEPKRIYSKNSPKMVASGSLDKKINWNITVESNGLSALSIYGTGEIPDLTSKKAPWDSYENQINIIKIGSGITRIGNCAFRNYDELISVAISDSVTSIGTRAFENCTLLKSITIPDSVTSIGSSAFENCFRLKSIDLPDGMQRIDSELFCNCKSLQTVYLPANLTDSYPFAWDAFYGCDSLTAFYISENSPNYMSENGILFSKDKKTLVLVPTGLKKDHYIVPSHVTTIGENAFAYNLGIKTIVIPESVLSIEMDAFRDADALQAIYIPKHTKIHYHALGYYGWSDLHECDNLTIYGFKDSDAYVASTGMYSDVPYPFVEITEEEYQSKLSFLSGTLPNGITYKLDFDNVLTISGTGSIPDFAAGEAPWFAHADKINTVIIDDGITGIGACAFYGCYNIYSMSSPSSITSIGYAAFFGCRGLSGFVVPTNVTAIGDYAFFGCTRLKYITLYPGIAYIGAHAFDGCTELERINLPDTITYIGDYAFSSCAKLSEIVVPVGVTELCPYVFNMCTGLQKVTVHSKVEAVDYTSFCGCGCQIFGYSGSYAQIYADSLKLGFVPLSFMWSKNSDWSTEELKKAVELQIFPEILKEKDLTQGITRGEFAAIAVKTYEKLIGDVIIPPDANPFTDTDSIDILKAYNAGITTGISETQFAPNALLNREQAATMLTRVFKKATIPRWSVDKDSEYPLTYNVPDAFWDDADISSWAKESVYFMTANGIVGGIGNNLFAPKNTTAEHETIGYANATREQALIIAVRMIEKLAR